MDIRALTRLSLFALGLIATSNCNNLEFEERSEGAKSNKVNIPKRSNSCLNVVGGKETERYPGVVLVLAKTKTNKLGQCTGTFVSPSVVFTASHCLKTPSGEELLVYAPDGKPHRVKRVFHYGKVGDDLNANEIKDKPYMDFAILELLEEVEVNSLAIASVAPEANAALEIVGFGGEWGENSKPIKRIGSNKVLASADGTISYSVKNEAGVVSGEYSERGDSGGPLFIDGKLAGVISVGSDELVVAVNINSEKSIELIEKARERGADIPQPGTQVSRKNSATRTKGINKSTNDQALQDNEICVSLK